MLIPDGTNGTYEAFVTVPLTMSYSFAQRPPDRSPRGSWILAPGSSFNSLNFSNSFPL